MWRRRERRGLRSEEREGGRLEASGGTQQVVESPRARGQKGAILWEEGRATSRAKATAGSSWEILHRNESIGVVVIWTMTLK